MHRVTITTVFYFLRRFVHRRGWGILLHKFYIGILVNVVGSGHFLMFEFLTLVFGPLQGLATRDSHAPHVIQPGCVKLHKPVLRLQEQTLDTRNILLINCGILGSFPAWWPVVVARVTVGMTCREDNYMDLHDKSQFEFHFQQQSVISRGENRFEKLERMRETDYSWK